MNKIQVVIPNEDFSDVIDYTPYVQMPFKFADLLDEQLDEGEIQLSFVDKEIFMPLTIIGITVENTPKAKHPLSYLNTLISRCDFVKDKTPESETETEKNFANGYSFFYNEDKTITIRKTTLMVVANDTANEFPVGSGKYNHSLYVIELTKILEGFIGDSITFTNPLGHNYTRQASLVNFSVYNEPIKSVEESPYRSPLLINTDYLIYTDPYLFTKNYMGYPGLVKNYSSGDGVFITNSTTGENIFSQYLGTDGVVYRKIRNNEPIVIYPDSFIPDWEDTGWENVYFEFEELGTLKVVYKSGSVGSLIQSEGYISVAENLYPPKMWTITDVINRTLDLIEDYPITGAPRFRFKGVTTTTEQKTINGATVYQTSITGQESGSLAYIWENVIAPEFAFTKMNLREMLQQIGGFVHAEPRITMFKTDNERALLNLKDKMYFEIDFDKYGNNEKSNIKNFPYVTKTESINVNDYCTSLDSSVDNLINQLDYLQGVVCEPFLHGYSSVRSETVAVRLEESDGTVELVTKNPIYNIGRTRKVLVKYNGKIYDLTPYIFEKTEYDNLSSFDGVFPYSKAYALYYTQGERSIKGLFFKLPDAVSPVFQKYAISNIMSALTGQNLDFATTTNNRKLVNVTSLLQLTFQINYLPIVSERIKTNKSIVINSLPRTLAYNQSANNIETRYFGENLKGVVARLGNVEKSYTYALAYVSDVPKVGYKFDDDYYISAVSTEILPSFIKCTIGLTKDFNQLSEYVGIQSFKRMWEVSERQTLERQKVLTEYIYITENEDLNGNDNDMYLNLAPFNGNVLSMLFLSSNVVTLALVKGFTKTLKPVQDYYVGLPVISSSFGNAMTFNFSFEDNYSAGQKITYENDNAYSGYVPYTDKFGKIYYIDWALGMVTGASDGTDYNANDLPVIETTFAENIKNNSAMAKSDYFTLLRKDNREVPSITYELQAVGDGSVIIGSGVMRNCGLVNVSPEKVYIIFFNKPINSISSNILDNFENIVYLEDITQTSAFTLQSFQYTGTIPENHVSWALITNFGEDEFISSDEDGKETYQKILTGGEIIIGQNKAYTGQKIYFYAKKNIYKRI